MGFQVSPGVEVKEVDLTNIVPAVSTTIGVFAAFEKAVSEITSISSEKQLVEVFGKPNANNFEYFFTETCKLFTVFKFTKSCKN